MAIDTAFNRSEVDDAQLEERLRAMLVEAYAAAEPSEQLRRRVARMAMQHEGQQAPPESGWWGLTRTRMGLGLVRVGLRMVGLTALASLAGQLEEFSR